MSFWDSDHYLDRLFRSKLKNREMEKPDHLWEGIARELDNTNRVGAFGYKWITSVFITVSILAAGGLSSYFLYKSFLNEQPSEKTIKEGIKGKESAETTNYNLANDAIYATNAKDLVDHSINNSATLSKNGNTIESAETKVSKSKSGSLLPKQTNSNKLTKQSGNDYKKENRNISKSFSKEQALLDNYKNVINLAGQEYSIEKNSLESSNSMQASIEKNNESRVENPSGEVIEKIPSILWGISSSQKEVKWKEADGCFVIKQPSRHHYYLDVYYAPELSKRFLSPKQPQSQAYSKERNNSEKYIGAYSLGIRGSWVSNSGIAVRTGISMSKVKERFDHFLGSNVNYKIVNGDTIEVLVTDIIENIYNSFTFYDIPVIIGYDVDLKDFLFSVNGGIGLNILARQKGQVYSTDLKTLYSLGSNHSDGTQGFYKNSAGLSLVGSFGLNYKFNEKFMLLVEPSFRYYLQNFGTKEYPLSQRYLQAGLMVGCRYTIL